MSILDHMLSSSKTKELQTVILLRYMESKKIDVSMDYSIMIVYVNTERNAWYQNTYPKTESSYHRKYSKNIV